MKWIKHLSIFCLCIVLLESLAQFRYQQNNIWLPMGLRKNIAHNSLESHRLNKNFSGPSITGIPFYTDNYGFRCSKGSINKQLHKTSSILLAGDSICFGMYEPIENSIGYYFNQNISKLNWNCLIQAIPGGSQAMTQDHLFGADSLAKQTKAKWILHSITHYDSVDNILYLQDKIKLNKRSERYLRKIKTSTIPYFIQMLQVKVRDFLLKDNPKNLLFADTLSRDNSSHTVIKEFYDLCKVNSIKLAFFFIPDEGELLSPSLNEQNEFEPFFKELNIQYFDLRLALIRDNTIDLKKVFRDDKIHLSKYGSLKSAEKLSIWFESLKP
jgi:hypothetical protein